MKKGFTLAEILVTLVTIGVLAALTIPSLVNNISDQQYKIAWRKAFADLSQVTMRMATNNGGSLKGVFTDLTNMRDGFLPYLNYIKKCDISKSHGNCWATTTQYLDGTVKTDMWNTPGVVLNNGNFLIFGHSNINCTNSGYGTPGGKPYCGTIVIDTNGFNGPNRWGKDIHQLYILENSTAPQGTQGDYYTNKCEGSTGWDSGTGCAAIYLYQ